MPSSTSSGSSGDIFGLLRRVFTDDGGSGLGGLDWSNIALALGGLYGASRIDNSNTARNFLGLNPPRPSGYQGSIPEYTAHRQRLPQATAAGGTPRRPGSGGRRYFTPMEYLKPGETPKHTAANYQNNMAVGGLASLVPTHQPPRRGYYLGGPTDGMADRVPANINGQEEAALSHGEFVMPADIVSHLGNGNSEAGAKVLYDMMARIRQARTGNPEQGKQINPNAFTPGGR